MDDTTSKNKKANKINWTIGIISLLIASSMVAPSNESGSIISAIFFYLVAFMTIPPIVKFIEERRRPILKGKAKIGAIVIFILAGIITSQNASDLSPSLNGRSLNDNQIKLMNLFLINDYNTAWLGGDSGFNKDTWDKILEINGRVTAKSILKDFKQNEVSAVKKYQGLWRVSGIVQDIDDNITGSTVALDGEFSWSAFNAKIKDKNTVTNYSKGDNVKLICSGIDETISIVYGNNCNDYGSWVSEQLRKISQNPKRYTSHISDSKIHSAINKIFGSISYIDDTSECYVNVQSDGCRADLLSSSKKISE